MLLARSAQTLYWFGRYLERAEDLSRAVLAYDRLALDTPHDLGFEPGAEPDWCGIGAPEVDLAGRHVRLSGWLLDERNPCSVLGTIHAAREDLRLSRPILPYESFQTLNQLYLDLLAQTAPTGASLRSLLHEVIDTCLQLSGQIAIGMMRDHAYCFLELGRSLERADMLLRVIRLFAGLITPNQSRPFEDVRCMALLESLAAYPMYRRCHHGRAELGPAFDFLIKNSRYPRSLRGSLLNAHGQLVLLPNSRLPLMALSRCQALLPSAQQSWSLLEVLGYAEKLLPRIADVHAAVSSTYFDDLSFTGSTTTSSDRPHKQLALKAAARPERELSAAGS